jgi:hypothetical protein
MGYVGWIDTYEGSRDPNKVHNVESQVVNELLSEGAVLYCKVPKSPTKFQNAKLVFTNSTGTDEPTTNSHGMIASQILYD